MKAKEFIPASKPRNFVAKNAPTSGAGRHKDSSKKKDQEQGKVKHKKDLVPMEGFTKADADRNKAKYQKSGRIGHGLDWKNYGDDYKPLVNDIVDKFDNITRLVQYSDAPESTKYKIVERFFKKYGYPFELFNDVITAIEKRAAGETNRYKKEGVAEGLPQTLRKVVPGYAKREIDKKMDAGKFGRTDVDKDTNYYRYKKIQDKLKTGVAEDEHRVAEGSAHGYSVVKWYEKNGDQKKLTNWLRKEAGLEKNTPLYFDDVDLVYGDQTIVPGALINPKLKFNDLLTAVVQATGGTPKQKVDGVYRSQGVEERVRDPEDWDEGNTEPGNNFAIYINDKKWKVFPGPAGAYADSPEERKEFYRLKDMAERKSQQTGKKWEVYVTGEKATESVEEGWKQELERRGEL